MADPTLTRKITRDKLARVFPNQEAIKVMENLTHDVAETLPANISATQTASLAAAAAAMSAANAAQVSADAAAASAAQVTALLQTMRSLSTEITTLRRELSELRAITQGTRLWL